MPEDTRGELLDGRFEYRVQKDGRVVVIPTSVESVSMTDETRAEREEENTVLRRWNLRRVLSPEQMESEQNGMTWYGRPVTILAGKDAQKFLARVEGLDEHAAQLLMARVTGNFKRGNEKAR